MHTHRHSNIQPLVSDVPLEKKVLNKVSSETALGAEFLDRSLLQKYSSIPLYKPNIGVASSQIKNTAPQPGITPPREATILTRNSKD